MAIFPTIKEMSEEVAARVLDEYIYEGKTLRQWIDALVQSEWIPVSERLPEIGKKVLVTSYGRTCYAMMINADGNYGYPVFRLQDGLKERTVLETTAHSDMTSNRITAWMSLPEPYKQESEVQDDKTRR